ncbi:MAG TPA: FAD:protein FMN transferase [Methylomirabilota bacterium]|nr:FAD:protein FMN transferase [Methylomirabilota bacterium]
MGRRCLVLSLLPAALGALLAVQTGCAPGRALPREGDVGGARFEYEEPQMGLPFRIVLYAPDRTTADAAVRAAFDRIAQLNAVLSDYDSDSELSRLSQTAGTGRSVPVSAELWRVLSAAQSLARRSKGAFDVTVGPYVNLWRKARRDRQFPDPVWLESARPAVGHDKLQLDGRRRAVRLLAPGMRLDLGGIAKGFALDEALRVLQTRGVRRALVSGGGDMVAGEPPPGRAGWTVTLAPMDDTAAGPAPVVLLARAALATSGDTFQRLELDGKRYSHIVDPRTGIGLTRPSLVTVIARDGMTADALATAVSVLGPKAGRRLVRAVKGAEVRFVYQADGGLEAEESSGFKKFYERGTAPRVPVREARPRSAGGRFVP